ncbi:MAG: alpha/beta hydrolase [Spirochaetales bacterium]
MTLSLIAVVTGCSSIPVEEDTLLQPKRSVTPQTFERFGFAEYELTEYFFPADEGTTLNGWHVKRPGNEATVLLFGGNGFYLVQSVQYLELFAALGVDVFMWDYRGYGLSEGEATVDTLKRDALSVTDFVTDDLEVDGDLIVHGHSLGSFMAAWTATERDVDAVVLESPATNTDHWLESAVPRALRMLVSFDIADELEGEDNVTRVQTITAPTLIAVGEDDFVTPPAMAELLYEESAADWTRLYMMPSGDHNSLPEDNGFRDAYQTLLGAL